MDMGNPLKSGIFKQFANKTQMLYPPDIGHWCEYKSSKKAVIIVKIKNHNSTQDEFY